MTPQPEAQDCVFCRIIAGDLPADVVHATDLSIAFRDINPQAPLHVLVVPRSHYVDAAELARREPASAADLLVTARTVAELAGFRDYRTVFNTGAGAGQTVFHAHLHVVGGRPLSPNVV